MGIVSTFTFTSDTESVTRPKLNNLVANLLTEFNGNIQNDNIASDAAIAYSKLNLTGSLVIADFSASGTPGATTFLRGDNAWAVPSAGSVEGTAVLSTGEAGGTKYLREDGDGTCSWQAVAGGGTVDTSGTPAANDIARFTDADTIEGRSYAELKSDLNLEIGTDVLAQQTIGIGDNNLVEMDDADAADNDYAKLTANGLEGRSYAEVKTDLSLNNVENTAISTWAGSANITTVGTLSSGDADAIVSAADLTTAGKVELATAAETTTGADATRAVTPDGLAGSEFGERSVQIIVFGFTTDTATGNGKFYFHIDSRLAGMNLVDVHAEVITAGTTGTTDIQIRNVTQAADMLSTVITIDSGETGSDTAATPAVIDAANDDVAENDLIAVDVDAVSTTAAKGLIITLGFRLP